MTETQVAEIIGKLREKSIKPSELALLHTSMMLATQSWIPVEEFMNTPLSTIMEIVKSLNYLNEKTMRKGKRGLR